LATQKLTFQPIKANFAYEVLRNYPKIYELFLEPAIKTKMLTFVLPTEKSLVVSFWTFFQISQQSRRIRKNLEHKIFWLTQGYLTKANLDYSLFPFNVQHYQDNVEIKRANSLLVSLDKKVLNQLSHSPPLKVRDTLLAAWRVTLAP